MMNEKEILTQIKKECRSFSPDNFERIKAMSIDEMAEFIAENINCGSCCLTDAACPVDLECDEVVKQWLQQESEG